MKYTLLCSARCLVKGTLIGMLNIYKQLQGIDCVIQKEIFLSCCWCIVKSSDILFDEVGMECC